MPTFTRLGLYGGPRTEASAQAGKQLTAGTRLGLYGGPRSLYGSFTGKSGALIAISSVTPDNWTDGDTGIVIAGSGFV